MAKNSKTRRAADVRGSSSVITPFTLTNLQCIGVLTLLVAVFFHKILLGQAYFWEDFLYQNYPFRSFAATSLAMGQLPLWNPYTFNGMPFLADIQTTVFYLPTLLLTLFVSNGTLNFYWLELIIILHFVLAGVGMFYLAKSFNLQNVPALFAGTAYMLSGYMIVHAIHQQNVTLVAWYPLIILFFRRALAEQRWLYVFLCGLALGHTILAGYPQLSLYLYLFLGVYFLLELFSQYKGKELFSRPSLIMTSKAATVVIISVALAMIQLLPTFELSDLSERAQITFEKAGEGSLAWSQLATLFFPKMFGSAGAAGFEYFGPGQYFYYWETCIYLGILPLLLGVLSLSELKKSKHVKFLWGVVLFSLLFALGNNFYLFKIFYDFVPGFSKFRIPARMGIFLTLAMSLLSAFSLQHCLYEKIDSAARKFSRGVLIALSALGILLFILINNGSFASAMTGTTFDQASSIISKNITPSLLLLLVSAAVLFVLFVRGDLSRFAGIIFVLLLFSDAFIFGGSQNNSAANPDEYFARQNRLSEFLKNDGRKELFRVNTRNPYGMLPGWDRNQGMIDRIFMLEGYTPLTLQRKYAPVAPDVLYDLLNVKYKTVFDEKTGQQNFVEHPSRMPRAFFLYNTHIARSEQDVLDFIKSPEFNHRTTAIVEKELPKPLSSASTATWKANVTNYTNNRITLDASTNQDGLLVLSEMYYPGWKAYVDGEETEIFRTDYNLRSLFVPAGEHKIEVIFESASFRNGMWISLVTLLWSVAGIVLSLRHKQVVVA